MKNLFISTLLTSLLLSISVNASESESELMISDEELTRVVCHHLGQIPDVQVAVAKAYSETESIIDEVQKNTLQELAAGQIDVEQFCRDIEI